MPKQSRGGSGGDDEDGGGFSKEKRMGRGWGWWGGSGCAGWQFAVEWLIK